jgi:amino acid transporter
MAVDVHPGLKKRDIKVSTVVFMIFCLCAAGAFGIEEMIPQSGPGLTIILLIVLPIVWSTPMGLVAAELGSARPQEGGYYKWVQEALGEFWGFQAGWWRTISVYIDNTLYVILAGGYVSMVWQLNTVSEFAIKAAMIIFFTYINIRGLKDVGMMSTVLSIMVIVAFSLVTIVGIMNWNFNPMAPITSAPIEAPIDWVFYIGGGLAIGMWMYSGYESMSTVAGEVTNPQIIPIATMITVPLIMATYVLPTITGLASVGNWESWGTIGTDAVGYSTVLTQFVSPIWGIIFIVVAILANCSVYNVYIASGSRGFFVLAEDNLAPPIMVKCDKKHGVPYVAVLSVGIANLILCMVAFEVIVIIDVFMFMSAYVMIFISGIILRKRIPDSERKFKIPGGDGFLIVLCVVPMIVAFIAFFINGTDYFIGGMLGLVTGPVLYVIWRWRYGGLSRKDPVKYPLNTKTGLAVGDLKRMAVLFFILGIMGILGFLFLPWYEGSWAYDYYLEIYGIEYMLEKMVFWIRNTAVAFLLLSLALWLAGKKLEPATR